MPLLKIPTPLRPYAEGKSIIEVPGENVSEVLENTINQFPALEKHLYSADHQLRPFVNLFLNEDNIKDLEGIHTPLEENDQLMIIPSIAGGTPGGSDHG